MSIDDTAAFLSDLRLTHRSAEELPAELMPPDLASAYQVQAAVVDALCAAWGGERAGYKVAVTNPAAQRMLGVPHPVFGRILSARLHRSPLQVRAADYRTCLIEVEIGFRMAEDVPEREGGHDRDSIAATSAISIPPSSWSRCTSPASNGSRPSPSQRTTPFTAPGFTAKR